MRPLTLVELGVEVVVERCGLTGDVKRHMDSLGILPGERITPVAQADGSLVVKVGETRLALNNGVAAKIYVR